MVCDKEACDVSPLVLPDPTWPALHPQLVRRSRVAKRRRGPRLLPVTCKRPPHLQRTQRDRL